MRLASHFLLFALLLSPGVTDAQDRPWSEKVFEESSDLEIVTFADKWEYVRVQKIHCDGIDIVGGGFWAGSVDIQRSRASRTYSLRRKRMSPKTVVKLNSSFQHDTSNTTVIGLSEKTFALHFDALKKRFSLIDGDFAQASGLEKRAVLDKVVALYDDQRATCFLATTKVAEGETYCFPARLANQLLPFDFLRENQAQIDCLGFTRSYDRGGLANFSVVLQGSQRKESDALTKIRLYGKASVDKVSGRLVSLELRGSMDRSWAGSLAANNYQGTLTLRFLEKAP